MRGDLFSQFSQLCNLKREQRCTNAAPASEAFMNDATWPVEDLFIPSIRIQLEPEVVVRCGLERKTVFEGCLDLHFPTTGMHATPFECRAWSKGGGGVGALAQQQGECSFI